MLHPVDGIMRCVHSCLGMYAVAASLSASSCIAWQGLDASYIFDLQCPRRKAAFVIGVPPCAKNDLFLLKTCLHMVLMSILAAYIFLLPA